MSASSHHITPITTLYQVLGALLVLTAITVLAAQFDFGSMNTVIAMLIATAKAALVVSIFMGLRNDDKLYLGLLLTGVFFLVLLFAISVLDIYTRVFETTTL